MHPVDRHRRIEIEAVLHTAMEDYIELLEAELRDVVPFADREGWESKRAEKGETLRQVIKESKEKLFNQ